MVKLGNRSRAKKWCVERSLTTEAAYKRLAKNDPRRELSEVCDPLPIGFGCLGLGDPWVTQGWPKGHPSVAQGRPKRRFTKVLCLQQKLKKGRVGRKGTDRAHG